MSYLNDLRTGELWARMKSYINNKLSVVDDKILHAGYSRQTLLWINPDPNSSFAAQTVALDLSDYDGILLQYYVYHQDTNGMHSVVVPVGDYGSMNIASSINRARTFQVLSTGVVFKDASKWTSYSSSSSTDNTWLTPYKIYGIKNGIPVSEADDALLSLKGVSKMIKLWENASPTSAFAGQKISLDLTNYDDVIIEVLSGISANASKHLTSVICPKGKIVTALAQAYTMRLRDFTVNTTNIIISAGRDLGTNWVAVTDNSSAIPFRIYGIKGVL